MNLLRILGIAKSGFIEMEETLLESVKERLKKHHWTILIERI